jgi:hypothetical protein
MSSFFFPCISVRIEAAGGGGVTGFNKHSGVGSLGHAPDIPARVTKTTSSSKHVSIIAANPKRFISCLCVGLVD